MRAQRIVLAAASAVLITPTFASSATSTTWTNATGNAMWADPLNWTGGVPGPTDDAVIGVGGSITLPTNAVANTVSRSVSPTSNAATELGSGRLLTNSIDNLSRSSGTLAIDCVIGSPSDALSLRDLLVNGTIGDGSAGGGTFDVIATDSHIRGASTTRGQVIISFSGIELGGSLASATEVVFAGGGSLLIPNGFASVDRLPDAGTLRLVNGVFNVITQTSGQASESVGTMLIDSGRVSLQFSARPGGSFTLTAGTLLRSPGTVLELSRGSVATIQFVNSPTGPDGTEATDRDVLGYGYEYLSDGTTLRPSFLTYDTGADPGTIADDPGLRPLNWNEYATSIASGGNVRLSGTHPLAADATVRSLNLVDETLSLNGATLTVQRGLIMQGSASASSIAGNGALRFPHEAIALTFDSPQEIDVPIQADLLTKGGDGELILTKANTFPEGVYIDSGTLASRAAGALGSATLTIAGGGDLRIEQASVTINQLVLAGYTKQTGAGSSSFGVFQSNLYTDPGVTTTIRNSQGPGQLNLLGQGLVEIPAGGAVPNTFMIKSGELRVDGQIGSEPGRGSAVVMGGTLSGTGTILGALYASNMGGGTISPGPGIATLYVQGLVLGNLNSSPPVVLRLDLQGADPGAYDRLVVTDSAFLEAISFDLHVGYPAQLGDSFTIIDLMSNSPIALIGALPEGSVFASDGYRFRLSYIGGDGNDVTLTVVPEPTSLAAMALLPLAFRRPRRRRA